MLEDFSYLSEIFKNIDNVIQLLKPRTSFMHAISSHVLTTSPVYTSPNPQKHQQSQPPEKQSAQENILTENEIVNVI